MPFKRSLWSLYLLVGLLSLPALRPLLEINTRATPVELVYYFANSTGMLGLVWMFIGILLGVRFVAKLLTPDVGGALALHKWLGKYGAIFVLAHPVLQMFAYLEDWRWLFVPEFSTNLARQINVGRLALLLYLIVWVSSAILRGRLKYRPWLYLHYLSYPVVLLGLNHIEDIGFFTTTTALLGILRRVAFVSVLAIILSRLAYWAGLWKPQYTVVRTENFGDDLFTLILRPQKKLATPKPGQYFYLQTKRFREAHPYSLMHLDEANQTLTFGVKALGPHSKDLRDLKAGDTVYLDGRYGVFLQESQASVPRVYWAGGIGVTPFVDSVLREPEREIHLHYSVQYENEILVPEELTAALGENLRVYVTQEEQTKYIPHRISLETVENVTKALSGAEHYLCGSAGFMAAIEKHLVHCGVEQKDIYSEAFSH